MQITAIVIIPSRDCTFLFIETQIFAWARRETPLALPHKKGDLFFFAFNCGSSMVHQFAMVVAATRTRGIGINGGMPWPRLPRDMTFFKCITSTVLPLLSSSIPSPRSSSGLRTRMNAVVMGRKTFDAIPPVFRALSGRVPIVITRDPSNVGPM
jgi:hypothetical protein